MVESGSGLAQRLLALRESYRSGLPKKLGEIERSLQILHRADSIEEVRRSLATIRDLAHRLVGSAGSFGLARVGEAARELEAIVDSLLGAGATPSDADLLEVERLVGVLARAADSGEA